MAFEISVTQIYLNSTNSAYYETLSGYLFEIASVLSLLNVLWWFIVFYYNPNTYLGTLALDWDYTVITIFPVVVLAIEWLFDKHQFNLKGHSVLYPLAMYLAYFPIGYFSSDIWGST